MYHFIDMDFQGGLTMEATKINIPDKVADLARVEYSKAYLYASLFIHSYQLATDALLECGAFNRDLIGKDREVQRAFDRFNEAMVKRFGLNTKLLVNDFDKYRDFLDKVTSGAVVVKIDGNIIDLQTIKK